VKGDPSQGCLYYFFFFPFGDFVSFGLVLVTGFFPFAGVFAPFGDFTFGFDLAFAASFFAGVFGFSASTNFSTVHATLTETTSSPGFTSTTTSPLVAARLRVPAASSRVDLGAPLLKWMVARWFGLSLTTPTSRVFPVNSQAMTPLP
jgi:hypothetical protein